ncbi:expressed unknown protein [Seminavis robusta]|uniref:CRAL-TRIO domain-containing protein n=1 Tax=Seminavis robusta TaxID=568900 RepID=A0A9N8HSH0_9STRA|nr:expressed unknown protein [Seminavis robusta]|eukprot:Sro1719_g293430.1 n/a (345) ;mRNA; r:12272-13306
MQSANNNNNNNNNDNDNGNGNLAIDLDWGLQEQRVQPNPVDPPGNNSHASDDQSNCKITNDNDGDKGRTCSGKKKKTEGIEQPPIDPSLFKISEQEKEWAIEIKDAIENLPDLDDLSDFMYVNLAISGKGSLEWAVDRAYKMQEVRQEYNIALTYEEGKRSLQRMTELLPNYFMSYDFDPHSGKCTLVMDAANPTIKVMRNPRSGDELCRAVHYMCYATFPSFESVRLGNIHIFECQGWQMSMNKVEIVKKIGHASHDAFPSNLITKFYHTSSMTNIFCSMAKKLLSKDVGDRWQFGCKSEAGRLDKFYMVPTPEAATQRVLNNWYKSLWIRMESEKTFKLDDE